MRKSDSPPHAVHFNLHVMKNDNKPKIASEAWMDLADMHALVIGINDYKYSQHRYDFDSHSSSITLQSLKGAVSDAEAIHSYLVSLNAPESQIKLLLNAEATRSNIIQGLEDLVQNRNVKRNAPILVYFAGHGGHGNSSEGPHGGVQRMEYIIPHDCTVHTPPSSNGRATAATSRSSQEGYQVYAIADRMLGHLLASIEQEHGDNILVILDCCHSGSGTRDLDALCVPKGSIRTRGYEKPLPLDPEYESKATGLRGAVIPRKTHTLLCACGAEEKAFEYNGRGIFTTALLEVLKGATRHLTLAQLMENITKHMAPGFLQNPQFEGPTSARYLFRNEDVLNDPAILVMRSTNPTANTMVLDAAEVHGIEKGCDVEIAAYERGIELNSTHETDNFSKEHWDVTIEADTSHALTTTVNYDTARFSEAQRHRAYRIFHLRVYIANPDHPQLRPICEQLALHRRYYTSRAAIIIQRVEHDHEADISVDVGDKKNVAFIIHYRVSDGEGELLAPGI